MKKIVLTLGLLLLVQPTFAQDNSFIMEFEHHLQLDLTSEINLRFDQTIYNFSGRGETQDLRIKLVPVVGSSWNAANVDFMSVGDQWMGRKIQVVPTFDSTTGLLLENTWVGIIHSGNNQLTGEPLHADPIRLAVRRNHLEELVGQKLYIAQVKDGQGLNLILKIKSVKVVTAKTFVDADFVVDGNIAFDVVPLDIASSSEYARFIFVLCIEGSDNLSWGRRVIVEIEVINVSSINLLGFYQSLQSLVESSTPPALHSRFTL